MSATRKYGQYTEQFRQDAVAMCQRGDRTLRQVAADLGVNRWTLREWFRNAEAKMGQQSRPAQPAPAQETIEQKVQRLEKENQKLQKQVERLEMDREILKKATAFFARENG
jgi:transposase